MLFWAQRRSIVRSTIAGGVIGSFASFWTQGGGGGAIPATGAGTSYTSATTGSIPFSNAPAGYQLHLGEVKWYCSTSPNPILVDRLVANSGLDANITTLQSFSTTALPRYTTGELVELAVEVYTVTGAGATTITVTYTNELGVGGRVGTVTTTAVAMVAGRFLPVTLQAGDLGVRSVQSIQLSAGTGTAGNIGVTLYRRICQLITERADDRNYATALRNGYPRIQNDACLQWVFLANTTSTGTFYCHLSILSVDVTGMAGAAMDSEGNFYAALLTSGRSSPYYKVAPSVAGAASTYTSLWFAAGLPGVGITPPGGSGAACTDTTAGALPITAPAVGKQLILTRFVHSGPVVAGLVVAYDRLVHNSGYLGTTATLQAVNTTALTRYVDGLDVELWIEVHATLGVTQQTATITYTNSDGVAGRTTVVTLVANAVVGRMLQVTLNAADRGIRSVESIQHGSMGGGTYGFVLMKRHTYAPVLAAYGPRDVADPLTMPATPIHANACLFLQAYNTFAATTPTVAEFQLIDG